MLSARSTVVAAYDFENAEDVLATCRKRLGLKDDDAILELWHASEKVGTRGVPHWPGIQPQGEITEYQLVLTR
eukprot:3135573-Amphidinium_carterae.1